MQNSLAGVKVLDLSRILAGPWCSQNLADLGAEVIKVEAVGSGDDTRGWGPPYMTSEAGDQLSAYFISCNRGKRSIAIDFSQAAGQDLVRRMCSGSHIVIENFKSGSLDKFGLDYASLRSLNPGLIYASITGFGQDGPLAGRPGYDYVFQGMAGFMSYTGIPDGHPGAGPLRAGVAINDIVTGMYATVAILAALRKQEKTGEGEHIDLALLDAAVALNANQNMNYLLSGQPPTRGGNAHPNCAPYEVFPCSDGFLILAIGNDRQFAKFCVMAGRDELADDLRFRTNRDRIENLSALREHVTGIMNQRTREDWGRLFDASGVPWGPIRALDEVFRDEQVKHREILQTLHHPRMGEIPTVRNPIVSAERSLPPPLLGEHTDEILLSLGISEADVASLRDRNVVA
ncbi:CaiB/BaiF CoA-transferase family protein [Tardiphaga sp.]|uniref:CaiB/BaiF CoA transferase family protein n=1 Tax=Tardiphaga sp. TaxID=1926292 RepID=UPI0026210A45|nr:CaiB/BaiF CoA-transferase family protein [Tardiphaga sp.]MDB5616855.1 CoA transferase [Tardiphaga sp.]